MVFLYVVIKIQYHLQRSFRDLVSFTSRYPTTPNWEKVQNMLPKDCSYTDTGMNIEILKKLMIAYNFIKAKDPDLVLT